MVWPEKEHTPHGGAPGGVFRMDSFLLRSRRRVDERVRGKGVGDELVADTRFQLFCGRFCPGESTELIAFLYFYTRPSHEMHRIWILAACEIQFLGDIF